MATGTAPALQRAGQDTFDVSECADNMIAVAHALRLKRDELLRSMSRQVTVRLAAAGLSIRGRPELGAAEDLLAVVIDIVITQIASDRPLSPEEGVMLAALAARKARRGFPHQASRLTVSAALGVAWEAAVEAVEALPPSHGATVALGRIGVLLGRMADAVPRVVAARSAPRGPAGEVAQLFAEMLSPGADLELVRGQLGRLGREVRGCGVVVLAAAEADADSDGVRAAAKDLLQSIPSSVDVPVSSPTTSHRTIILCDATQRWGEDLTTIDTVARPRSVIALCAPPADVGSLVRAYHRCVHLVGVARRMHAPPGVVDVRRLRVPALLNVPYEERQRFLEETLGPVLSLPERHRRPLLCTLFALRNAPMHGGASAAARELNVHVKTVYYRLKRIRELTGLDPEVQADQFELTLAVELLRFPDAAALADSSVKSATLSGAVVPFPSARR